MQSSTLARPYAKAVFEVAKRQSNFDAWSDLLLCAQFMVSDKDFRELINHPKFSDEQALSWMKDILKDAMFESGETFLRLLAQNGRLGVLPEIYILFEQYRQAKEQSLQAHVVSAKALTPEHKQQIEQALKKKLGAENISLHCEVDETLWAGALIRAGDVVIDGTAKGRLSRLSDALGV